MKIVSIMAEMPVVPDAGCRDIKEAVQKLEGRFIRPGFTAEVRDLFGKAAGCLHLTNLILAMNSAAVQGLWSYLSRMREGARPLPSRDRRFDAHRQLPYVAKRGSVRGKDPEAQDGPIRKEIMRGG